MGRFTPLLLLIFLLSVSKSFGQVPEVEIEEDEGFEEIEMMPEMEIPKFNRNKLQTYPLNGKLGLKLKDSILTPAIFDQVQIVQDQGFIVTRNQKQGFYSQYGKEILPIKYKIVIVNQGYLVVAKKDLYALCSLEGKRIVPFRYQEIHGINSVGLIAVTNKNGATQLLNSTGKLLQNDIDRLELFVNGAIYTKSGKFGFANATTNTDLVYDTLCKPMRYSQVKNTRNTKLSTYHYSKDYIMQLFAERAGKIGLIDAQNNVLIPVEQDDIQYEGMKGYYVVTQGKKKGFYLPRCNVYHKPEFDGVYMDGISYLQVNNGQKRGLYSNKTGELILPVEYSRVYYVTRSYIITKDRKIGVMNLDGDFIIPIEYDEIDHLGGLFSHKYDDLYKVKLGDSVGVVNALNEKIVPIVYQSLYDFEDRFYLVRQNNLYGLLSLDGKEIQAPQYTYIQGGSSRGYKGHICLKDSLFGMLDEHGANFIKNEYKAVSPIHTTSRELELPLRGSKARYLNFEHVSGKNGIINMALGTIALPVSYDEVYQRIDHNHFAKTLFVVKRGTRFGLVDAENKVQIAFDYDTLDGFAIPFLDNGSSYKDIAIVAKKNGKYGVINLEGEIMVPFAFDYIEKLGLENLFKAKKRGGYQLINERGIVLNTGPFDEISQIEYSSLMLTFFQGKMRKMDSNGHFISKEVAMLPHEGFRSFAAEKDALKVALNSEDDSALYHFAEKIAPSDHLMSFLEEDSKLLGSYHSNGRTYIIENYYLMLLKFKYSTWNSRYFNQNTLEVDDYVGYEYGIVTNKRLTDWAYSDTRILEKFIRNSIKINGYWISSYYLRERF